MVNKLVLQIENRIKGNSIKIIRKIIEKKYFFLNKDCASLEGGKGFIINELIPKATSLENLAQMDPLWYPWL